jgi:CheY-like chemotaxis protein
MAAKTRIFVVEDHQGTAEALKLYLENQGYIVAIAENVASAVKYADTNAFDLLICDLRLPDGTGWDLMKKLSASGAVRAIAFTASGNPEDVARSRKVGFMEHLVKGSPAEDLVRAIEDALKR